MLKDTKVAWTTASGVSCTGVTLDDERANGHILVASDAIPNEEHRVIYCATTWLTVIP